MAGVVETDAALLVELGPDANLFPGQDGLGEDAVEARQEHQTVVELVGVGLQQSGEARQNALHLLLLVQQQLFILVPQLHHRRGLDEQGLARAALVVDEARDLPPMLRLHGDGVAAVAHGDDGVLQVLLVPGAADDAIELIAHLLRGQLHLPPDAGELRGGVVRHLLLGEDAAGDLALNGGLGREPVGDEAQEAVASLLLAAQDRFPGPAGHLQTPLRRQQLPHGQGQHRAHAAQGSANVGEQVEGRVPQAPEYGFRLRGLLQKALRLRQRRGGRKGVHRFLSHVGNGKCPEQRLYLVEFQGMYGPL